MLSEHFNYFPNWNSSYFDNPYEYETISGDNGKVICKSSDGSAVSANVEDPEYCRYKNWASRHPVAGVESDGKGYFFAPVQRILSLPTCMIVLPILYLRRHQHAYAGCAGEGMPNTLWHLRFGTVS